MGSESLPNNPGFTEKVPESKNKILDDLLNVGPDKPVGYLPIDTLEKIGVNIEELERALVSKGLRVIIKKLGYGTETKKALFAYDRESLSKLLDKNREVLNNSGWPIDPDQFILYLEHKATPKTNLFNVIADAFGDRSNRLRKRLVSFIY